MEKRSKYSEERRKLGKDKRIAKRISEFFSRKIISNHNKNINNSTELIRKLYMVPHPEQMNRPDGISLMVVNRNEPWIELSLRSIEDIVNEIIVVDASTTEWKKWTFNKLKQFNKVRFYSVKPDYKTQTKLAVDASKYKWLFRWDADFVAFDKGLNEIKDLVDSADRDEYHAVTCYVDNLELIPFLHDISTRQTRTHSEKYLFTYFNRLTEPINPIPNWFQFILSFRAQGYVRGMRRRMGYAPAPIFFKRHIMNETLGLHLRTVKPWQRVVEKKFQPQWALMEPGKKNEYQASLWTYVKKHTNPELLYEKMLTELIEKCVPYRGPWPDIMIEYMEDVLDTEFRDSPEFRVNLWNHLNRFGGK